MRRTAAARHHRGPWILAGCASSTRPRPSVSTSAWRLRPLDLLARIVAAGATSLGRLDALAVDNRAARAGLASDPLAIGHDQRVIDLLKETVVAELGEPAIDRAPRWQIAWQQAPRAASPHHVENAVDDLSASAMTGAVPCHEPEANEAPSQPTPHRSNQSDNAAPCGYAALRWSASTWRLQIGLNNLPETTSTPGTQPLSKRPLSDQRAG